MSSILEGYKLFGIVALISGLISVIAGLYSDNWAIVIIGLALLVIGALVYAEKVKGKVNIVKFYLIIYGIAFFIAGTQLDGLMMWFHIVVGILALFIGLSMYFGEKRGEIWWIILLVVFLVLTVIGLLDLSDIDFGTLKGIVASVGIIFSLILNVYMLFFLFSKEVKSKFK